MIIVIIIVTVLSKLVSHSFNTHYNVVAVFPYETRLVLSYFEGGHVIALIHVILANI